jgi:Outer membrane lipoprotein-sorting protein
MLKRRAIFGTSLWDFVAVVLATILLPIFAAKAETTNNLSDAEIQGRALVQKILAQWPEKNFTKTGTLVIRRKKSPQAEIQIPVRCKTIVTETNWLNQYEAKLGSNANDVTILIVIHSGTEPNHYLLSENGEQPRDVSGSLLTPFAGSDFWFFDLGLEFFHWPQQKVLPKITNLRRGREYTLLESTNPNPATNGYSRVLSWIDKESGGILEAKAFDAAGNELKDFYPKSLEKVNGQYQVQSMVMENLQTGSKSVFDFDLDK